MSTSGQAREALELVERRGCAAYQDEIEDALHTAYEFMQTCERWFGHPDDRDEAMREVAGMLCRINARLSDVMTALYKLQEKADD